MTPFPAPNRLHVWWARRPLVASRAAVLASLLPADADRDKFLHVLGIHGDPVATRRRIDSAKRSKEHLGSDPYGYRRAFTYTPDGQDKEWVELAKGCSLDTLSILDPTAGGGSIPFEGTVKFSGSVADLADETRHAELPWISIPTRHYQPRRLAVSPLRCEVSRCRRSPGPTRHYGVLRSDPAVVPHVRFSIRSPAQASTGPAGRHLAPGRGLRHHPGTAALSLACRRSRW